MSNSYVKIAFIIVLFAFIIVSKIKKSNCARMSFTFRFSLFYVSYIISYIILKINFLIII